MTADQIKAFMQRHRWACEPRRARWGPDSYPAVSVITGAGRGDSRFRGLDEDSVAARQLMEQRDRARRSSP